MIPSFSVVNFHTLSQKKSELENKIQRLEMNVKINMCKWHCLTPGSIIEQECADRWEYFNRYKITNKQADCVKAN